MPFDRTTRSIPCAVLVFAAALLSAAPASADPNDGAFVDALAKGGIAFPDHNAAISIAHGVCAGLDQSNKSGILAMKVMKETNFSMKQSSYSSALPSPPTARNISGTPTIRRAGSQPGPPLM